MIGPCLKQGLARLSRLPLLLSLFFLYQLLWGVVLYLAIKSVLTPILLRLPDKQTAPELYHFFLIESQIQWMKTDVATPILIAAVMLIGLRLVITPILNAGLYAAIQNRDATEPQLAIFIAGMRKHAFSFMFIHVGQWVIMLLPVMMLAPLAGKEDVLPFVSAVTLAENRTMMFALLTGACLYFALIRLMTMYVCFGRLEQRSIFKSLARWGRHALPTALITIGLLIVYTIFFSLLSTFTLKAAGFTALLIYFAGYGLRLLYKCWEISTLGHYYTSETK